MNLYAIYIPLALWLRAYTERMYKKREEEVKIIF